MFTEVSTQFVNDISALVIPQLYPTEGANETERFSFAEDPLRCEHEQELAASAIHPDLWDNVKTLRTTEQICEYLLASPTIPRTNTGRVAGDILRKYINLNEGWVIETFGSDFAQVKPKQPRCYFNQEKDKEEVIKYESPLKMDTDIIRPKYLPEWLLKGRLVEKYWEDSKTAGRIYICEGAKKTLSLLSLGLNAIGITGINNILTKKKANGGVPIPALVESIKNQKEVVLVLDAPDKLTQHKSLESAYTNLKNLSLSINPECNVKILAWDWHMGKGIDDCLAAGNITKANIESLIVPFYEGIFKLWDNVPAHKRITGKRYLSLEDVDNFSHKITFIKAGKGSGKTEIIGEYLKSLPSEIPIFNPTHRIRLGKQNAKRLGTNYHNDMRDKYTATTNRITICMPSILDATINPDDFKGGVVPIDEVRQFLEFAVSGLVKPESIRLFQQCLLNASKIIGADADLDMPSLVLLDQLMPEVRFLRDVYIVEMEKATNKIPMTVTQVSPQKVGIATYNRALECLLNGEKILVMVDSQNPKSKLGAENLKRALVEGYKVATGQTIKGLALYASATKDKGHEASRVVTEGIDAIYQYDFVVYTAVIGTGVSLDKDKLDENPYFDRVLVGWAGAIHINDGLQGILRYRRPVPREVLMPKFGIAAPHAGDHYSWRVNRQNTLKVKQTTLAAYQAIAHEVPTEDGINRPLEDFDSKRRARLKYERDNYLAQFCKKADQDYDVTLNGTKQKHVLPVILGATVEATFEEYKEKIISADLITNSVVFEEMKAKDILLPKEKVDFDKTSIAKQYRIESAEHLVNDQLLECDANKAFLSGIRNHYSLDRLHYVEEEGKRQLKKDVLDIGKFPKDKLIPVQLLKAIGIEKLLEIQGEILHRDHAIVKEIVDNAIHIEESTPGAIFRHLHMNVPRKGDIKNDPMTFIESLADKLALTKKSLGRSVLPNGKRVRMSKYWIDDSIRFEIFEIWDENNELSLISDQMQEFQVKEQLIVQKLNSLDVSEEEKTLIRAEWKDARLLNDALKQRAEEIIEARNLRAGFERYRQPEHDTDVKLIGT
jgi:hypothetical protein